MKQNQKDNYIDKNNVLKNENQIVLKNKTNRKECIYIIMIFLIILSIIINLIIGLWFNNKLNVMNRNWTNKINSTLHASNTSKEEKRFDFGPLIAEQPNYDAKSEYLFYDKASLEKDTTPTDKNGVALTKYKNEYQYNPVSISQYGLEQYSNYIESLDKKYYDNAKIQADYLLEIQDKSNGKFYYNYDFKVGGTNQTMKAPWSSAMAQGQVISLLSRIYYVSKEKKYLDSAKLAMKPLTIDVKDGGLCADFFGYKYYEEYPTIPASYTLNGFMFTLIGLHDLYSITDDKQAKELYDDGIKTLEYCLPFYDSTGISLYHLGHLTDKNLSLHTSEKYHNIHIGQLKIINKWENNATFMYYADKWEGYVKENS